MKWCTGILLGLLTTNLMAEEIYLAQFKTLNQQINGKIAGSVSLWIKEDKLVAYTRFFAGHPGVVHRQNVYLGKRCPEARDDINGDGYLDIVETGLVMNNIIIPLDGDLSSQMKGINLHPVGDQYGSYFYEKETRYSTFLKDLKAPDLFPEDNIVKLGRNEKLNLEGKSILIQGVAENSAIPDTVLSHGEVPAFKTLPVACGQFRKVLK